MEEKKAIDQSFKVEKSSSSSKNYWKITTIILGIVSIALLVVMFTGVQNKITGKVISGDAAGKKLVNYLNGLVGGGVEYVSYKDEGNSLYSVKVKYQGQEIPVYVTKDGKYFVQGAIPLDEKIEEEKDSASQQKPQQKEVPKSDKPIVEAFVFSYCPYGIQFEKALIPVYELLKNKADFRIVAIGAMHGEYEKYESLRQICIEKLYGKDKFMKYLKAFSEDTKIGACRGDEKCLEPLLQKIYSANGMSKQKIDECIKKDAEAIYNSQVARADELGISGSPTFVINGVVVSVNRSPESIKQAVCNAFNNPPEECSKTLSTKTASVSFGPLEGGSASTSSAQC